MLFKAEIKDFILTVLPRKKVQLPCHHIFEHAGAANEVGANYSGFDVVPIILSK